MLLECQNCGAPLDARSGARIVKCRYCGRSNTVDVMRTVAPQTPPHWHPPSTWTPPEHFPEPSRPLQHRRDRSGAVLGIIVTLMIIGGVLLAVPGLWTRIMTAVRPGQAPGWDGTSTLLCGATRHMLIENKTVTFDGTLIKTASQCMLRIKNCTLKGRTIIEADQGSRIDIENSTLIGDEGAITGSQNVVLHISKKSSIRSLQFAISLDQSSKVYLRDSSVQSPEVAISLGQGSKVYLRDSSVQSDALAIHEGQSSELEAFNSKISSPQVAIRLGQVSRVVLSNTKVRGREYGVRVRGKRR